MTAEKLSVAGVRGEVTVTSKATGCPLSHEDTCWTGVDINPAQVISNLYPHQQMSLVAKACQSVPQEVVARDHKAPMSA